MSEEMWKEVVMMGRICVNATLAASKREPVQNP